MGTTTATRPRWTAPPLWPEAPDGWTPPVNWRPAPAWTPAPHDWSFWRCPDTAADLAADPDHRSADLDRRVRPHIAAPPPAAALISFLDEIRAIGDAALHAPDAAGVTHSPSRVRLLRSISSAAQVLTDAAGRGVPAPFVFFACVQDAFVAAARFAAERSAAGPWPAGNPRACARFRGHTLFDGTMTRIMVVFHRAVDDIAAGRPTAPAARRALRELDEVRRLVEMVGHRSLPIGDLLPIVEALDACGRRAAATLGVTY